jgi:hypothetical protein
MHLITCPLEFTPSVSDFVGDYELLTNPGRQLFVCKFICDCGICSKYFSTLCEMLTDGCPTVKSLVIVAFAVNIFQLL